MRKLTIEQREVLKSHLLKKRIEYVELYDEIYDHYASAYEQGNEEIDDIIRNLDQHFNQEYIDLQREKIANGIYKKLSSFYKEEFIEFFHWPQIILTCFVALIMFVLARVLAYQTFEWFVFLPSIALFLIPAAYFFIQIHRKLILPFNLKSAYYEAMNKVGTLPIILFNCFNFISIMFGDSVSNTHNPYVLVVSMLVLISYTIITFKVFKQKIKYQLG